MKKTPFYDLLNSLGAVLVSTLVSTLLTTAFPSWALAEGNSCRQIFVQDQDHLNERFQKVFRENIDPQYQKSWLRLANEYYREGLVEAKKNGAPEIAILEKLGFKVDPTTEMQVPTLMDFFKNYHKLQDELGIPEGNRLIPTIALGHGERGEKALLFSPLNDQAPADLLSRQILYDYRPKSRQIAEHLVEGRFPVFHNGIHDVFHMITFVLHPEYAKALRDGSQKILKQTFKKPMLNRAAYFLEALSLPNPKKIKEIESLITLRAITKDTNINDFINAFKKLSKEELEQKSKYWKEHYQDFIIHYAGGKAEPYERNLYRNMISFEDAIKHFIGVRSVKTPDKILSTELITEDVGNLDVFLDRLKWPIELPQNVQRVELMRLQLARMEYALWKGAKDISVLQWARDTFTGDLDLNSPTMVYIRDVFGENSVIYRDFAGIPPKY